MSKAEPPRPMGFKKYRKTIKTQFLKSLQQYAKQLEAELQAVYGDPNTMVGKFATAYQQSQTSNKRLSSLCATMIKHQGGKVALSKEELESFKGMVVNIKWEVPEGAKPEEATEYVFSYDALTEEQFSRYNQHPPSPGPDEARAPAKCPRCGSTEKHDLTCQDQFHAPGTPPPCPSPPAPAGPAGYDPSQEKAYYPGASIGAGPESA